jgi:hypothetical protein
MDNSEKKKSNSLPYIYFILGMFTILTPLVIFYVLSLNFSSVDNAWNNSFCSQPI